MFYNRNEDDVSEKWLSFIKKNIAEIMKQTEPWRRKSFLEHREKILKDLATREKGFDLQTTLDKIEELKCYRQKETLEKFNNKYK